MEMVCFSKKNIISFCVIETLFVLSLVLLTFFEKCLCSEAYLEPIRTSIYSKDVWRKLLTVKKLLIITKSLYRLYSTGF